MINQKLVEYAKRFIAIQTETASIAEFAAAFGAQLRAGCHQDLVRLLGRVMKDMPEDTDGKTVLRIFGESILTGDIEAWGMPDCDCNGEDCVYCSTGMAIQPAHVTKSPLKA